MNIKRTGPDFDFDMGDPPTGSSSVFSRISRYFDTIKFSVLFGEACGFLIQFIHATSSPMKDPEPYRLAGETFWAVFINFFPACMLAAVAALVSNSTGRMIYKLPINVTLGIFFGLLTTSCFCTNDRASELYYSLLSTPIIVGMSSSFYTHDRPAIS